jgi:hypothetical protein
VIGAPDGGPESRGSAFIYRRVNGTWVNEAKLVPGSLSLHFGSSVAVKEDVVAVADALYGDAYQGAAYVYKYDSLSSSWIPFKDKPITNDDCAQLFGSALELMDDKGLMIGCYVQENHFTGAVYSYSLSVGGDQYEPQQSIAPPGATADDFSEIDQIAVDGNMMLVQGAASGGNVYVFVRDNYTWRAVEQIEAPLRSTLFGYSIVSLLIAW